MSIDPEKMEAIRKLPPPTDPKSLRSFLHMVQFNLEFLHPAELDKQTTEINYQQLVAPLRALTRKEWLGIGEKNAREHTKLSRTSWIQGRC